MSLQLVAYPLGTQVAVIDLVAGWNLISLPIVPVNPKIDIVLASQLGSNEIVSVWTYSGTPKAWLFYTPGKPSTLTTMSDGNAYWIYMLAPDRLYIDGTVIAPNSVPPSYSLSLGWNLVGFKPQPTIENETVSQYLSSIAGSYDANNVWVYDNTGGSWIRADSSYMLQPGQAMWILMTAPSMLRP